MTTGRINQVAVFDIQRALQSVLLQTTAPSNARAARGISFLYTTSLLAALRQPVNSPTFPVRCYTETQEARFWRTETEAHQDTIFLWSSQNPCNASAETQIPTHAVARVESRPQQTEAKREFFYILQHSSAGWLRRKIIDISISFVQPKLAGKQEGKTSTPQLQAACSSRLWLWRAEALSFWDLNFLLHKFFLFFFLSPRFLTHRPRGSRVRCASPNAQYAKCTGKKRSVHTPLPRPRRGRCFTASQFFMQSNAAKILRLGKILRPRNFLSPKKSRILS